MYDKSDMLYVPYFGHKGALRMKKIYEELHKTLEEQNLFDPSSGILLTPSYHGENCMGNGKHKGYECCCDECDYYLACFPDWQQYSTWQTTQKR